MVKLGHLMPTHAVYGITRKILVSFAMESTAQSLNNLCMFT